MNQNKGLESANAQFKTMIDQVTAHTRSKSRSKRASRKSSSLDRHRVDLENCDLLSTGSQNKKTKTGHLFLGFSRELTVTHPPPESVQLRNEGSKKKEPSKKKTSTLSGTESTIPSKMVDPRSVNFSKREKSPGHRNNLKGSLEADRLESNYFRNCNNIYFAYGNHPPLKTSHEGRSKEKVLSTKIEPPSTRPKTSKQVLLGQQQRPVARSKSKDSVDNNLSAKLAALSKRYKKVD